MAYLNVRDIQLLLRIYQTGHIAKAAEQLHLSGSAARENLDRIENELQMTLFERTKGRGTIVTGQARQILPYLLGVLGSFDDLMNGINDSRLRGQAFRLGIPSIVRDELYEKTKSAKQLNCGKRVTIVRRPAAMIRELFDSGELDAVLVGSVETDNEKAVVDEIAEYPLGIYLRQNLLEEKAFDQSRPEEFPWIQMSDLRGETVYTAGEKSSYWSSVKAHWGAAANEVNWKRVADPICRLQHAGLDANVVGPVNAMWKAMNFCRVRELDLKLVWQLMFLPGIGTEDREMVRAFILQNCCLA